MKVLVFTNLYPNKLNPNFGVFIRNRTLALNNRADVDVKVVAPVPWFPPIKVSKKWYQFSQIPKHEVIDGIDVYHPRYLVTPKIGMSLYGFWMFLGVRGLLRRLRRDFPFELIDAHFLYPDGYAACLLGDFLNCPVTVTARGSDVTSYIQKPIINKLIQTVFRKATSLVAVSRSLKEVMVANGADESKLAVISNGIDPSRFYPLSLAEARQQVGISGSDKIVLTVCSLVELKGVHLLIEALSLLDGDKADSVKLVIIGTGPEGDRLKELVDKYSLADRVVFVGSVANEKLVDWYNAADLFFLGSSREGWPNVVCESLACGTPVVATAVNGIPEILDSEELGIMVERSPAAFADGIAQALGRSWNRQLIAQKGRQRTWQNVAAEVHGLFSTVIENAKN